MKKLLTQYTFLSTPLTSVWNFMELVFWFKLCTLTVIELNDISTVLQNKSKSLLI